MRPSASGWWYIRARSNEDCSNTTGAVKVSTRTNTHTAPYSRKLVSVWSWWLLRDSRGVLCVSLLSTHESVRSGALGRGLASTPAEQSAFAFTRAVPGWICKAVQGILHTNTHPHLSLEPVVYVCLLEGCVVQDLERGGWRHVQAVNLGSSITKRSSIHNPEAAVTAIAAHAFRCTS